MAPFTARGSSRDRAVLRPKSRTFDASSNNEYATGVTSSVKGLTRDAKRVETLTTWGNASDRTITSEAMYEMMTTDLRPQLAQIKVPTLVLGSWAAYAPYGATKESTTGIFKAQYAQLNEVQIELSEAGYHFLMWDDAQWLQAQVRGFIGTTTK